VSLRQNGVGRGFIGANDILPKGHGHSRQSVLDFCGKIETIISPLNSAVIYYAVDNIAERLERIAQMRGRDWIRLMEQRDVEHHGLDAFGGSLLQF
jgi:hypothetical protein